MKIAMPLATSLADPILARWMPFIVTATDVLTPAECDALVARIEAIGPELATVNRGAWQEIDRSIRDNERVIFDDVPLAALIAERLAPAVPATFGERGDLASGMNERFRCYRYSPGQRFKPHYDGAVEIRGAVSAITVLVYLNDDCDGGETAFPLYDQKIQPERGMALLFQHDVLHEGCPVTRGRKYVLRTDVLYRRA